MQHHKTGFRLESTREAQSWSSEADLAEEHWSRDEGCRNDVGRAEEDQPKSSPLEGCRCGPMFPEESRGISQVSQVTWHSTEVSSAYLTQSRSLLWLPDTVQKFALTTWHSPDVCSAYLTQYSSLLWLPDTVQQLALTTWHSTEVCSDYLTEYSS
jgi:hypothetical protein